VGREKKKKVRFNPFGRWMVGWFLTPAQRRKAYPTANNDRTCYIVLQHEIWDLTNFGPDGTLGGDFEGDKARCG
jgi:hypothetical protein